MGSLDVEVSTDGVVWVSVWSKGGEQGNSWQQAQFDLLTTATTQLRFSATTGSGYDGDISIDDVVVRNMVGASSCTACEAGKFAYGQTSQGAGLCASCAGSTSCSSCTSGQYQPAAGSGGCLSCPAGTFSGISGASSSAACQDCAVGTYQSRTGASECLQCAPGYFCPTSGLISFSPCSAGTYSEAGATSCSPCPLDTFSLGSPAASSTVAIDCDFDEEGLGPFNQTGDFLWTRINTGTGSGNTGPDSDHTTESIGVGYYYFTEASGANSPYKGPYILEAPLGNSGLGDVSFYYNMLGNSIGTLLLQTSFDRVNWNTAWTKIGNQGAGWKLASLSLDDPSLHFIRFSATTGAAYDGDISIDDVLVTSAIDPSLLCTACAAGKISPPGSSTCNTPSPTLPPTPAPTAVPTIDPTMLQVTRVSSTTIESPFMRTELLYAENIQLGGVPLSERRLSISNPDGDLAAERLRVVVARMDKLEGELADVHKKLADQRSEITELRRVVSGS